MEKNTQQNKPIKFNEWVKIRESKENEKKKKLTHRKKHGG